MFSEVEKKSVRVSIETKNGRERERARGSEKDGEDAEACPQVSLNTIVRSPYVSIHTFGKKWKRPHHG